MYLTNLLQYQNCSQIIFPSSLLFFSVFLSLFIPYPYPTILSILNPYTLPNPEGTFKKSPNFISTRKIQTKINHNKQLCHELCDSKMSKGLTTNKNETKEIVLWFLVASNRRQLLLTSKRRRIQGLLKE